MALVLGGFGLTCRSRCRCQLGVVLRCFWGMFALYSVMTGAALQLRRHALPRFVIVWGWVCLGSFQWVPLWFLKSKVAHGGGRGGFADESALLRAWNPDVEGRRTSQGRFWEGSARTERTWRAPTKNSGCRILEGARIQAEFAPWIVGQARQHRSPKEAIWCVCRDDMVVW